jgi:hypothetical protein
MEDQDLSLKKMLARLEPLPEAHKLLVSWACACAAHVLHLFPEQDDRPRNAIAGAKLWLADKLAMTACRELAFAAHAAARSSDDKAGIAAARAAGHAAATAHVATHAIYAAQYAGKAVDAQLGKAALTAEQQWQLQQLKALVTENGFIMICNGT